MNAITKFGEFRLPPDLVNKLTPSELRVAQYINDHPENPRFCDMNSDEIKSLIQNILLKAKIKLGGGADDSKDIGMIMTVINEDLALNYATATRMEIYAALDAGLNGDFLEGKETRVFFSPSNFVRWMKTWMETVKRPLTGKLNMLSHNAKIETLEISEKQWLIKCFDTLREKWFETVNNINYEDYGGILYDFMIKFNLMEPISDNAIADEAKALLFNANFERRKSDVVLLTKLMTAYDEGMDLPEHEKAIAWARRKAVKLKLRDLAQFEHEDAVDYFALLKEDMIAYFNENNLQ